MRRAAGFVPFREFSEILRQREAGSQRARDVSQTGARLGTPALVAGGDSVEVIVGAILTQNTSWTNVERAIATLRAAQKLSVEGIREVPLRTLQRLIRSSGYFRQKAQRLKNFVAFLDARYAGALDRMFATPIEHLRAELLALNGIGAETADSVLLYAGNHAIFVVDAYTRRILERHGLVSGGAKYDEIRNLVERALQCVRPLPPVFDAAPKQARPEAHPPSAMSTALRTPLGQVCNEMHGLFVQVGKHYCQKTAPKCEICPLGSLLEGRRPR
jgi:endonuclease III related protein